MGRVLTVKRFTLVLTVALLVCIGILPVLVMLVKSVTINGEFSLIYYKSLLSSSRQWTLLGHSLTLSLITTILSVAIGLPLGILFGKSDLPFRRVFTFFFTIPLMLPPYIIAVSWSDLLSRKGFLSYLSGSSLTEITSAYFFALPGCVLVLFTTFMPIVMLLTITYVKTVNPHLEEAGRLVGRWTVVLKEITIPIILPGVLLAAMFVFILTLGEFSVPMFLRYDVFPVESFSQFSAFYNFSAGAAYAIPLVLITFVVLMSERVFSRKKSYQLKPASDAGKALFIRLGCYRWWFFAAIGFLCLIIIVAPIIIVVIQSASVAAYSEAFARGGDSLQRSILYAMVGATGLSILGWFSGYLIYKKVPPFWRFVDSMTIFLLALPGTVIGIGLISLWNRPSTNFIYGTAAIIIIGYIAKYSALTSRITAATLSQIPPSMTEAAQMVGAKWWRRIMLILAPLAKRGLIAGWLVGYIFCLRDTGITMMIYPPGHDTLPVRIFTLMANGSADLIAALCVIMIIATLLPLGVLAFILNAWKPVK